MSDVPTTFSSEKDQGVIIIAVGALLSLLMTIHTIQLAPAIAYATSKVINIETWNHVKGALTGYYNVKVFIHNMKAVWSIDITTTITSTIIMLAIGLLPVILALKLNPNRLYDLIHGDAKWGTSKDIKKMEKRKQVGINGGKYLHLGLWDNKPVRLIETLSTLALAPPGTGKTASLVVPSIIETDDISFVVNDPKPELFDLTSGHRAKVGHVFMLNWSTTDKVDPAALDDKEKTIFYPRFNVLSPKLLPPAGTAERDTYLDTVANVLSPGGDKGGKSDYFEQKGRSALVGFLHYLCSKIADVPEGREPNKFGLPAIWDRPDAEPSIPMLIDIVNEGQHQAGQANDEKKAAAEAEGKYYQGDAMGEWFKAIVQECRDNNYNPRAFTELQTLVNMAPNERSGIIGTIDKAFGPFKNAAVRERTSKCDFVPADLRGLGPNGEIISDKMLPVTLYMCVNQAEAASFATITSLVYEILSKEFLAYGPGEKNRNNRILGQFPVCFMLDEFAKLPAIEAVITGPDLGRGKKTMYCLVAQAAGQIGKLYSKEDQQIMYATTGVKYILPQNDTETIKLVKDMVGTTTLKRFGKSRSRGGDWKEIGKSNESISFEKIDLLRDGDISGMKPGTHILICQGFMNRPYLMKSVMFFENPEMLAKVNNPRTGLGPKPCYPVPEYVRQRRIAEWRETHMIEAASGVQKNIELDLSRYDGIAEPKAH